MEQKAIMGDMFLAESAAEEAAQLMGTVNALHNIWKAMPEIIDEHLVAAMFGFKEARDAELDAAKKDADQYWGWFQDEQKKRIDAESQLVKMERTVERLTSLVRLEQEQIQASDNVVELKGMED